MIAVYDNYNGIDTVRKESEFEVTWWLSLKISIYETGISITFDNIRTLSLHQYIFLTVANNKQLKKLTSNITKENQNVILSLK